MNVRNIIGVAVVATCTLASCSKGGGDSGAQRGTGGSAAADKAAAKGEGFEGSVVTSGLYAATWTAGPESPPNPFNAAGNLTVTSDKQTFGNIFVGTEGTFKFGSGATELAGPGPFQGTGAKVTLDKSGQFVCAFTIDTDLEGKPGAPKLHVKGRMTSHWHPQAGDLSCP